MFTQTGLATMMTETTSNLATEKKSFIHIKEQIWILIQPSKQDQQGQQVKI